jgi:hypothetical protein
MQTADYIDIDEERDWNEPFWELTNLSTSSTGLTKIAFVAVKWFPKDDVPILRLSKSSGNVSENRWCGITIPYRGKPKLVTSLPRGIKQSDVDLAITWIELNRKVLRDHWFGRNDSCELITGLQPV